MRTCFLAAALGLSMIATSAWAMQPRFPIQDAGSVAGTTSGTVEVRPVGVVNAGSGSAVSVSCVRGTPPLSSFNGPKEAATFLLGLSSACREAILAANDPKMANEVRKLLPTTVNANADPSKLPKQSPSSYQVIGPGQSQNNIQVGR